MNRISNPILLLVPHEALGALLILFLVLGGLCRIVGARRASTGLIATAIAIPFATVIVEALFNELFAVLPPSLVKIVAWCVMGIVYLVIFGSLMSFLFGEGVWGHAKGQLLADSIKGILRFALTWPLLLVWVVLALYLWIK
jgi:hypothetical protein